MKKNNIITTITLLSNFAVMGVNQSFNESRDFYIGDGLYHQKIEIANKIQNNIEGLLGNIPKKDEKLVEKLIRKFDKEKLYIHRSEIIDKLISKLKGFVNNLTEKFDITEDSYCSLEDSEYEENSHSQETIYYSCDSSEGSEYEESSEYPTLTDKTLQELIEDFESEYKNYSHYEYNLSFINSLLGIYFKIEDIKGDEAVTHVPYFGGSDFDLLQATDMLERLKAKGGKPVMKI